MRIIDIIYNVVEKSDIGTVDRKDGWVTMFKSDVNGVMFASVELIALNVSQYVK